MQEVRFEGMSMLNKKSSVHLIHIGDRQDMERAIELFLDVPETWMSFPGDVLGVSGKHIEALRHAEPPVHFEPAKKAHLNGQKSPVQPK
jgi:hypothetical protein